MMSSKSCNYSVITTFSDGSVKKVKVPIVSTSEITGRISRWKEEMKSLLDEFQFDTVDIDKLRYLLYEAEAIRGLELHVKVHRHPYLDNKWCVVSSGGKICKEFDDEKEANEFAGQSSIFDRR